MERRELEAVDPNLGLPWNGAVRGWFGSDKGCTERRSTYLMMI